jgi:hypothetical protein
MLPRRLRYIASTPSATGNTSQRSTGRRPKAPGWSAHACCNEQHDGPVNRACVWKASYYALAAILSRAARSTCFFSCVARFSRVESLEGGEAFPWQPPAGFQCTPATALPTPSVCGEPTRSYSHFSGNRVCQDFDSGVRSSFRFADNPPTILDQTVGIVPPSMM